MRTTLTIDPAVLTAAKSVASQSGKSIGAVISEWAMRGLSTQEPRADKGFPRFQVTKDALPITNETVRRLLDNEGLPSRR